MADDTPHPSEETRLPQSPITSRQPAEGETEAYQPETGQISDVVPADENGPPTTNPQHSLDTAVPSAQADDPQAATSGQNIQHLSHWGTDAAPTFRFPGGAVPSAPPPPPKRDDRRPPALLPGEKIDDFEIIRLLGRGAFGNVYLARQLSLDREVALKISANQGSEGRTMARLEHAHIVQVFSERVEESNNQRLLCMQLVPGLGLERIITALAEIPPPFGMANSGPRHDDSALPKQPWWTGAELLSIIERNTSLPAALDPASLRDREALGEMDAVEATAWIGARLAEALDFAHRHGVLHRDIKPANILFSSYGRPMLADFNISAQQAADASADDTEDMFGGTIAYMAPEHLDAFNPSDETPHDAVNERADIYSLGLVLYELLYSERVPPEADRRDGMVAMLRRLADARRNQPPTCREGPPDALKTLEGSICKCLAPEPNDRFFRGAELAEQLDGCRQLRQAERRLPKPTRLVDWILKRPFFWFVWLGLLPQLAGSAINTTYNLSQVVRKLTESQQEWFWFVATGYNLLIYPIAVGLFAWVVLRVRRGWRAMHGVRPLEAGQVADTRREALRLPLWVAGLSAFGWWPGGVIFPTVIHFGGEPLNMEQWIHFIASFTLSGLIAMAYALCASQFVVERALYPRMWDDVRHFTATTRGELAPMATRLSVIQGLAGSIPLLAAGLFIWLPSAETDAAFKSIVTTLIVLGGFGYHLTTHVTRSLTDTTVALTGAKA